MTDAQVSLDERLGPVSVEGSALADQIFDIVGNAIVEGTLEPGEKVNDKELAAALGISRTPVREALQRLTWVGLVEVAPSRYTRVTEITDEMVSSTLEYMGMQASIALQLAMRRMDADELTEAVGILDRVVVATEAGEAEAHHRHDPAVEELATGDADDLGVGRHPRRRRCRLEHGARPGRGGR